MYARSYKAHTGVPLPTTGIAHLCISRVTSTFWKYKCLTLSLALTSCYPVARHFKSWGFSTFAWSLSKPHHFEKR